jgi:glutamyl-tRNA reductase
MVTTKIRETIAQIRNEELNRYKKQLKGCENIIAEQVTQQFMERLVQALEDKICKDGNPKSAQALVQLFVAED